MNAKGHYLTKEIICGWLLALMESDLSYSLQDLVDRVEMAHEMEGGLDEPVTPAKSVGRVQAALWFLEEHTYVVEEGERWRAVVELESLSTFQEVQMEAERRADLTMGTGPQNVYGWYLPAYRQLAELKGEKRFAMKVGTTLTTPRRRMTNHIGTAPEKPVLGFVLKIGEAGEWERMVHQELKERGRHIATALGKEWFRTNPDELRRIVVEILAGFQADRRAALGEGLY